MGSEKNIGLLEQTPSAPYPKPTSFFTIRVAGTKDPRGKKAIQAKRSGLGVFEEMLEDTEGSALAIKALEPRKKALDSKTKLPVCSLGFLTIVS